MSGYLDYLSEKYQTQNIKAINEKIVELSSLFEISQILNASLEITHVLNNILLIPMGRLMISRGIVFLRNGKWYHPRFWKGLPDGIADKEFSEKQLPSEFFVLEKDSRASGNLNPFYEFVSENQLSLAIPLKSKDQLLGLVIYGPKLNRQPFSNDEIDFLTSLVNLSASTVENALHVDEIRKINQQLDERIQQLKTLFDIAQGLSATLDSEKIVKLLTYALMGQMLVYHYAIVIHGNQHLPKMDVKGFVQDSIESLSEELSRLSDIETAALTVDLPHPALKEKLLKLGAHVFIPMRHQNKMLGFILLGEKISKQKFTAVDLEFLTTLVSQAVISLENARLFKEMLEKQRYEQELQVAKTIQKKLLPREIPQVKGYDLWGVNISSKEVGGDYFDVIPISEHEFALAIGDVSGKSVPAALLMANLQAGLRTIISEAVPLEQIVGKLNRLIYQNTDMDKYITFFVGVLDNKKNRLSYVNAGHNPPILMRKNGEKQLLDVGGIILGMLPEFPYQLGVVEFDSIDLLVCYTDGVNEALNTEEEEYGEERLENLISSNRHLDASELSDTIVSELREFSRDVPQFDDITLLITRRL
ncbi:MAG: SpoIIE family protein phosphatase [Calditrichia bacterium]